MWTAWDYFGETGIGHINYHYPREDDLLADRYPNHIANCGDIDICGNRRVQSYYREIAHGLRKEPYIACTHPKDNSRPYTPSAWGFYSCEHSWCFKGYEGEKTTVYVFADCDEIILEINKNEVGRQKRNDTGIYSFDVVYEKGSITATSLVDGKIIGKHTLTTEGEGEYIRLIKEQSYLAKATKKPSENIVYVQVELCDKDGKICTQGDVFVEYKAEGAEILGVASRHLTDKTVYSAPHRNLYKGASVVVLKKVSDAATLVAKAEGLPYATINI